MWGTKDHERILLLQRQLSQELEIRGHHKRRFLTDQILEPKARASDFGSFFFAKVSSALQ